MSQIFAVQRPEAQNILEGREKDLLKYFEIKQKNYSYKTGRAIPKQVFQRDKEQKISSLIDTTPKIQQNNIISAQIKITLKFQAFSRHFSISSFQIACWYLIYFQMQNYLDFLQTSFLSNTNPAINSIISFQLSQICKSIQTELQYELLRNEFLKSKISVPEQQDLPELKQAKVQAEQKVVTKIKSCPMVHRIIRRKRVFECKIETKNLPKNFGKAIITYIQNNPSQMISYLSKDGINYEEFVGLLMEKRLLLNTIQSLRDLWLQAKFPYSKQMRELSMYFLRKHCFKYIFNSRIKNMRGHVKYRKRLLEAIERPHEFTSIKTLSYKWTIPKKRK